MFMNVSWVYYNYLESFCEIYFVIYVCMNSCMYVCEPCAHLELVAVRKGHLSPWNQRKRTTENKRNTLTFAHRGIS